MSARYDFFISYAHEDLERARQLDRAIRNILRPLWRRYRFNTFRDEATLPPIGDLDDRLCEGLRASTWLVVVLTEASARSYWVDREIEFWCKNLGRRDHMIIVRADESVDLSWDRAAASFCAVGSLPPALVRAVHKEPQWVDASGALGRTWYDTAGRIVAAKLRRPPDDVFGEDYRNWRRRRRLRAAAVTGLSITTVLALTAGFLARRESELARRAQNEAEAARAEAERGAAHAFAQQAAALASAEPALSVALAADALERRRTPEILGALHVALLAYGRDSGRGVASLPHDDDVRGVAFDHDGATVATASGLVTATATVTGGGSATVSVDSDGTLSAGAGGSSNGGSAASAVTREGTGTLWDPETGERRRTLPVHGEVVEAVAFSADDRLIATAGEGGTIRLWDPESGGELRALAGHGGVVSGVAFSPDGSLLATAGADGSARLWDPESGGELRALAGHGGVVSGVAFSPDGSLLATAGADGSARLWDPESGERQITLDHGTAVEAVAFNQDGTVLATGGGDGTVKLWDPRTGSEIMTLSGHSDAVLGVAFDDDGSRLATASRDGTALVRDLVLTPRAACALVADDVTHEDLRRALGGTAPRACRNLR